MKLFTDQQYQKLIENGTNPDQDHAPVVKVFIPLTNCVWLLSELDPETPSVAFGLCDLGVGFPELGYVVLDEIIEAGKELLNVLPACDPSFEGKFPMSVYADAARMCDCVTDKEELLIQCNNKRLKHKP